MTNIFISDYDVANTFCAEKDCNSFTGFKEVIEQGKIVVLNIAILIKPQNFCGFILFIYLFNLKIFLNYSQLI